MIFYPSFCFFIPQPKTHHSILKYSLKLGKSNLRSAFIYLLCVSSYFKYILGSTWIESFNTSKCKCASSAISNAAVFPTVPML